MKWRLHSENQSHIFCRSTNSFGPFAYLPTNRPTYLPTYLHTYLTTYVHTYLLTYLPTNLLLTYRLTDQPTYQPTNLQLTYVPFYRPTYLLTYLLTSFLPTYLLTDLTTYQPTNLLLTYVPFYRPTYLLTYLPNDCSSDDSTNQWTIFHSRPIFNLYSYFQTNMTIFTTNVCEKCPSSIRFWYLNPRSWKHESPPITTRHGSRPDKWTIL